MRHRLDAAARKLRSEDGYTLTEMLVVIAVIAMIAAVLTPQLMGQMSRARAKTAQLHLDTIASGVELFRDDVGRYPTKEEGVGALLRDPGADGWTGPYLKDSKMLNDPWSNPVKYEIAADNQSFYVESLGSDKKIGGSSAARDLRAPAVTP